MKKLRIFTLLLVLTCVFQQMSNSSYAQEIDPIKRIYGLMAIDSIKSKINTSIPTLDLIESEKEILDIYSSIGYNSSLEYISTMGVISELYFKLNDFNKSLEYSQNLLDIVNLHFSNRIDLKSHLMYQMSECYYKVQNYQKAIEFDYQNLEIIAPCRSQLFDNYLYILHNLASSQFRTQDLTQTLKTIEMFIDAYNTTTQGNSQSISRKTLATYYDIKNIESAVLCEFGEYSKALISYNETFPLIKSLFKEDEYNPVFAEYDMNVGMCYVHLGDNAAGAEHINKVAQYYEIHDRDSREYACALQMLSQLKFQNGITTSENDVIKSYNVTRDNYSDILTECIFLQKKSVGIFERAVGRNDIDYLSSLLMLATYYRLIQDNQNFIATCEEVINICDNNKVLQGIRPHLAALDLIGDYYAECNNNSEGIAIAKRYLELTRNNKSAGRGVFTQFESEIRLLFKNGFIDEGKEFFDLAIDITRERLKNNSLLLQDEGQRNAYWDSDASYLISAFTLYEYYSDLGDTMYDVCLLYKGAKLYLSSKDTDDKSNLFSVSWDRVKNSLRNHEIAIEFIKVIPKTYDKGSSPYYIAITLRHDDTKPIISYLCKEDELVNINNLKSSQLSHYIWGSIKDRLSNIYTIYFSPMGELNNIAIEYLPYDQSETLMTDKYHIFRLTSTREITLKNKINQSTEKTESTIYGGILYDAEVSSMETESRKYSVDTSLGTRSVSCLIDSLSSRGGVGYLKYTKTEAEQIYEMMTLNNHVTSLLTGEFASEESFKNLSGKRKSIIHIATHGFYWEKDYAEYEASLNEKLNFMLDFVNLDRRNVEDKALNRSGLYMAGVNNILRGKEIPASVEDGILTAHEIASLDLRGLDLVVLSACQTGMGDINGDGVFGLQRGFKKAGANSILMSLWDVDDKATEKLMTEFYKNYLGGMSKSESLLTAQKKVRETPGFEDPVYWAAFILLDALN